MARKASPASAPVTNVFSGAPVIAAPTALGKTKLEVISVKGVEIHAACVAVGKFVKGFQDIAEAALKATMRQMFKAKGRELKERPDNFRGEEGIGSSALVMKASASALSDENIALFTKNKIALDTEIVITETFIFNPDYANDQEFMRKMEKVVGAALMTMQDDRGPIIQKQQGKNKVTVSEAGMHQIFAVKDEKVMEEMMDVAFSMSITSKLANALDLPQALKIVEKLYKPEEVKPSKKKAA